MSESFETEIVAIKINDDQGWCLAECRQLADQLVRDIYLRGATSVRTRPIGQSSYWREPSFSDFRFYDYNYDCWQAEEADWRYLFLDHKWYPRGEVYLPPKSYASYTGSIDFEFVRYPGVIYSLTIHGGRKPVSIGPACSIEGDPLSPELECISLLMDQIRTGKQDFLIIQEEIRHSYLFVHNPDEDWFQTEFEYIAREGRSAFDFVRIILIREGHWYEEEYCDIEFDLLIERNKLVKAYFEAMPANFSRKTEIEATTSSTNEQNGA